MNRLISIMETAVTEYMCEAIKRASGTFDLLIKVPAVTA